LKTKTIEAYPSCFAHGLMFHRFHKSGKQRAGQGSVTEVDLEKIINYVGTERILQPADWIYRVKTHSLQKHHLCITFDDGLRSQFDVALPILEKYRLKAFWFVFSSVFNGGIDRNEVYNRFAVAEFSSFDLFVAEFLKFYPVDDDIFQSNDYGLFTTDHKGLFSFYTENDLKYRYIRNKLLMMSDFEKVMDCLIAAKGLSVSKIAKDLWLTNEHLQSLHQNSHCIGLHSYDHPFEMAIMNVEEQKKQYLRNRQHISNVTGDIAECMSHPLNSYSQNTIDILSGMGIVCGFRSNVTPPSGKAINAHRLELAREDGINILKILS
jgi:peptidoglycan/xylan/chitin deacetylase (PgdA/CDA1 family)